MQFAPRCEFQWLLIHLFKRKALDHNKTSDKRYWAFHRGLKNFNNISTRVRVAPKKQSSLNLTTIRPFSCSEKLTPTCGLKFCVEWKLFCRYRSQHGRNHPKCLSQVLPEFSSSTINAPSVFTPNEPNAG